VINLENIFYSAGMKVWTHHWSAKPSAFNTLLYRTTKSLVFPSKCCQTHCRLEVLTYY